MYKCVVTVLVMFGCCHLTTVLSVMIFIVDHALALCFVQIMTSDDSAIEVGAEVFYHPKDAGRVVTNVKACALLSFLSVYHCI